MSKFIDRLKQSLDQRLPHFSTSIPYVIATVLIMLVPLTVTLSQQTTRLRSGAQAIPPQQYTIKVTVIDAKSVLEIYDARVTSQQDLYAVCYTDNTGICNLTTSKSGIHTIMAFKGDLFGKNKVEVPSDASEASVTVVIDLPPNERISTSPPPGSKEFTINVHVKNSVTGKSLEGATVTVDDGAIEGCTTGNIGTCPVTVHEPNRVYNVAAEKTGFIKRSRDVKVLDTNAGASISLFPDTKNPPKGPTKSPDGSQPPADDTKDPNTGNPNPPDSGGNPPGPDDLKCLGGSCETPTPTPNYCITPVPSNDQPDSGTPPTDNGLRQSILERVRQQINEVFSRFGDFFNTNPKPPSQ